MKRLLLCLLLYGCSLAQGQITYTPPATSNPQYFDNSGKTCAGCKLYSYSAGTVTPLATYTDATGGTPNTNPIILDSAGRISGLWLGPSSYKLVLKTSADVTLWTVDNLANQFVTPALTAPVTINHVQSGTDGLTISGGVAGQSDLVINTSSATGGTQQTSLTINNTAATTNKAMSVTATGLNVIAGVFSGKLVGTDVIANTSNATGAAGRFQNLDAAGNILLGKNSAGTAVFSVANTGAVTTASNYTSTVATGTAPLVVSSTTPVANLTTLPLVYNSTGTQQVNSRIVTDSCTLGTNCAVTLTGSAVFTSSSSYFCAAQDVSSTAATKVAYTSGSQFTITGTGTDNIRYICVGN